MTIRITYLATVIIAFLLLIIGNKIAAVGTIDFQNPSQEIVRAKVQKVIERVENNFDNFNDFEDFADYDDFNYFDEFDGLPPMLQNNRIIFEARITHGLRKGEIVTASQSSMVLLPANDRDVFKNASILLIRSHNEWYFNGFYRINGIIWLGVLFVLCVLILGGRKGVNTILSLGLTCAAIFTVFIPAILAGKNIYLMAVLVCIYTTVMTLLIVIGFNKKSLVSVAGCVSGILAAGIIAVIMDRVLNLTGIIDEHSRYLINMPGGIKLNLRALIFAGIIIGAMGAIMDVAISIASSLWEIKEKAKLISFKSLFHSGLNIGRDIMGSMANTLILAYIGSSLSVVLLLSVFSGSTLNLFNSEMIAVEILQALAGSFGILSAMPLTAFFCSVLYLKEK
ncbi:MAG: YibE/F family protein [Treponema sp.]|nr:YibE/F family protein [Treponema sp.]